MPAQAVTAQEIAARTGGILRGPGTVTVSGVGGIDEAGPEQATYIATQAAAALWPASKAGLALVSQGVVVGPDPGRALIEVPDAELALVWLLEQFAPEPALPALGTHPSAAIDPSAQIGSAVRIGAHASVGAGSRIGSGCVLHPGARVGDGCTLGAGCLLHANAVVRERCVLGGGVVLHAGAVVGSDGFGYRPGPDGRIIVRVPHLGTVELCEGVEIGAGTCVDRAKFGVTRVGAHTKIDNLCQIGHNCSIGRCCVIAALTGLAGSVRVGNGCRIGGHVGIRDHARIGDGAQIAAKSAVMGDVPAGETWGGTPAQDLRSTLREVAALRTLAPLAGALRRLLQRQES